MNSTSETNIESWQWEPQPAAAAFVQRQLDLALQSNHWAQSLQSKLRLKSGTRLIDWLDHLILSSGAELLDVGYEFDSHRQAYVHTGGLFPQIVVDETLSAPLMAIKVESIEEFVSANSAELQCVGVEGAAGAVWRMAFLQGEEGSAFRIVERCGYAGLDASLQTSDVVSTDLIELSLQSFRARLRSYEDPEASFLDAKRRFDENAQRVGPQRACCLFFQSEREFWQFKNDAAKIQLQRQSRLGRRPHSVQSAHPGLAWYRW